VLLRFHGQEGTHGVAVGPGLDVDLGDLAPGEVKEVLIRFATPGTFTFYCNKWCSPNHWRMRGVVEVRSRDGSVRPSPPDPVITQLIAEGVNIDDALSTHGAAGASPSTAVEDTLRPSAVRGAERAGKLTIPAALHDEAWRRRNTPATAEAQLSAANPGVDASTAADVTAYLWLMGADPAQSRAADTLYAKNCAECHGPTGDGAGFAAGLSPQPPPPFSDPARMATRRSDVLYAKIRRGGMGTGMPNFGTLFTAEETWALVDRLWRFTYATPFEPDLDTTSSRQAHPANP
jgi:mono/diheme cytochrome c family protein